jgi:glycerol kinase
MSDLGGQMHWNEQCGQMMPNNRAVHCIGMNTADTAASLNYARSWKVLSETYVTRVDLVPSVKMLRTIYYQVNSDGLFAGLSGPKADEALHKAFVGALIYDACCDS